jgi:hypothetical protein
MVKINYLPKELARIIMSIADSVAAMYPSHPATEWYLFMGIPLLFGTPLRCEEIFSGMKLIFMLHDL